jgi:hypothetical protein
MRDRAPLPTWKLHVWILAALAGLVALIVASLFSRGRGHGLDGLGAGLAGIGLLIGFITHASLSTIFVARSLDRRGVVGAHLASLGLLVVAVFAMMWID